MRVEQIIRYIRENVWPSRQFVKIADLNEQARTWCAKANRRVHSTTQAVPAEQLAHERLQPLPERKRVEHLLGTVRIPGRCDGLKLDKPARTLEPLALGVPAPDLETHPPSAYEAAAGGANG